jgi:AraC family transcriptional activator of pobA
MLNRMIGTGASSAPRSARQARIETLERLIGLHFRDQWRVADYAGALNITPTHLNRLVREALGTSVHDLVMARVTDEACRSLVFTHTSIHLIAEQLGFADGAYFIRWFRKRTSLTPGLYRKMERQRMQEGIGL